MRGVSSGDKRIRDLDNPDSLPSSKKQKTHHDLKSDALNLLEFADLANAKASQDCINAQEKILKFLRDNPESLDVSSLSPATLTALPSGALGSAASAVKRLVLPEHLYSVPAICDEMPALQELILRGYSGRQLNLLKWVQLQQVSGSVSVMTEDIYLNSTANISLTTPRMTKLRCYRLQDNGDFRSHALPGQSYYKTLRGRSQPDLQSMNGMTAFSGTDVPILCRHIAAYVLPHLQLKDIAKESENGYLGISDLTDLPKKYPKIWKCGFMRIFNQVALTIASATHNSVCGQARNSKNCRTPHEKTAPDIRRICLSRITHAARIIHSCWYCVTSLTVTRSLSRL